MSFLDTGQLSLALNSTNCKVEGGWYGISFMGIGAPEEVPLNSVKARRALEVTLVKERTEIDFLRGRMQRLAAASVDLIEMTLSSVALTSQGVLPSVALEKSIALTSVAHQRNVLPFIDNIDKLRKFFGNVLSFSRQNSGFTFYT